MTTRKIPLYEKIVSEITEKIESGELKQGDRLETDKELSDKYDVSRVTIRKAIDTLVENKKLRRVPNKGVYVNIPKVNYEYAPNNFLFERLKARGLEPSSKILSMEMITANKYLQEQFECEEEIKLIKIKRIRYIKNTPYASQVMYMKESLFPEFNPWNLQHTDMHEVVEGMYGHRVLQTKQYIKVALASEEIAENLEIEDKEPVLKLDIQAKLVTGEVYEVNESFINTSVLEYSFIWTR